MVIQSRRSLVDDLDAFDRLLEVGIGNRPDVAAALERRGRTVVAIDVSPPETPGAGASDVSSGASDVSSGASDVDVRRIDVGVLAVADDPLAALAAAPPLAGDDGADEKQGTGRPTPSGFDAVYARNLPAELQRPTVDLADRFGVTCRFTTLGFEEPVVPVTRRTLPGTTLFVARAPNGPTTETG